jgi:predicted nuclease of restriction endonuclease-like RecB superfamily
MVLRIQYLKYRIVPGGQLEPYFLGKDDGIALATRLLEHLESFIEQPRREVDLEEPVTWVPDIRVARALIATAFSRFYKFIPRQLDDLVINKELTELHKTGITNLEEVRRWFWRFVEEKYKGFIPRSERIQAYTLATQELHLSSPETLEHLLIAHREEYMLLRHRDNLPSAQDLLHAYNYEVLETLLYHSESVSIILSKGSLGTAARTLLRLTKRFGVLVDLEQTNGGLRATIAGPRLFFGRSSPFGWNIAQVLTRLIKESGSLGIQIVDFTINVVLRDRHYIVRLTPNTAPSFLSSDEAREDEAFLDSKVEEQFYWSWHSNKYRGWDIVREPDAIIIGKRLIIPDFALIKNEQKVLLEIVGYWREEYTRKKLEQLQMLQASGLKNLILLVDRKYRQHFTKCPYPSIFYTRKGRRYDIPYGKVLKALPG